MGDRDQDADPVELLDETKPPPGWGYGLDDYAKLVTRNGRDWYTVSDAWVMARREAAPLVAAALAEQEARHAEEVAALRSDLERAVAYILAGTAEADADAQVAAILAMSDEEVGASIRRGGLHPAKVTADTRAVIESALAEHERRAALAEPVPEPADAVIRQALRRSVDPGEFPAEPADSAAPREPVWIVNDIGELGVLVDGRAFFLYKGESLEYAAQDVDGIDGDGLGPMMYRPVLKREFGEVTHPFDWWDANGKPRYPEQRYRRGDGWRPIPDPPHAVHHVTCPVHEDQIAALEAELAAANVREADARHDHDRAMRRAASAEKQRDEAREWARRLLRVIDSEFSASYYLRHALVARDHGPLPAWLDPEVDRV